MQRLRVYDIRLSDLPGLVGRCSSDLVDICRYINRAERRLLQAKEAGDEGWWGTWAEMRFNMQQAYASLTLPRGVARLEVVTICDRPVPLRNQFYDYLDFGNGRMPRQFIQTISTAAGGLTNVFGSCFAGLDVRSRNMVPMFSEITSPPQNVLVYPGSTDDTGQRVLLQGLDPAGNVIYSQDGLNRVQGQYVALQSPFVQAVLPMSKITGIQKDITAAPIQIFQSDPTTGAQTLIHTMEPTETTGWYRRYYFNQLPINCCGTTGSTLCPQVNGVDVVQVTAIAKLEHIDVAADTDYTVIQNLEALTEEAQAIRYESLDTPTAKQMAIDHHRAAIGLLNGELTHYLGLDNIAVNFKPFGSARLERQRIGTLL